MIVHWMIGSLLFSAFVAIAAWRADAILRAMGRQTRHVWIAALLACLGWPAVSPVLFTADRTTLSTPIVVQAITPPPAIAATPPDVTTAPPLGEALLVAWIGLSTLLAARLLWAVLQLHRIRRAARPHVVDGHQVLLTEDIGPAVVGGARGEIFIPAWLLDFEPSLRALVFRHEQEHRAAHDPLALWLSLVVTALMPWNIPVWFVANRLRLSLEIDCDARTMSGRTDRERYARLLLLIAQHQPQMPFASTLAGTRSGLSTRIGLMTQKPSHYSTSRLVLSGLVVLAALAAACSTRIASNLTSPQAPDAASGAPGGSVTAAAADAGAAARGSQAVAAQERPLFDFQTERPAVPTGTVRPEYPAELRAAGIEGSVLVQIVVDANGIPEMATFRVLKSANEGFSASVRDALSRMTFTPAQAGGRTVRQLLQIPFGFELSKPTAEWVQGRPATAPVVSGAPRGAVAPARPAAPTSSTAPFFDFQVEKPAQVRPGVTPTYPAELRARGVEGSVLVQFVVNEDGTIDGTTVRILRSTGDAFSDAVREALPTMQYTPAETAGRKVKQLVQQRFGFAPDSR